jgi:stage II sporulation protein D
MKSRVNSVLNSIIAVLVIGGLYMVTALTAETTPVTEPEVYIPEQTIAFAAETIVTTAPPVPDEPVPDEPVPDAPAPVAPAPDAPVITATKRSYNFVVEPPKIAAAAAAVEKLPANELEPAVTTVPETVTEETTTAVTTTTPPETTTAAATTAAATTAPPPETTVTTAAAVTEDLELYEEDDDAEILDDDEFSDLQVVEEPDVPLIDEPAVTTAVTEDYNENVINWNVEQGLPADTVTTAKEITPAASTLTARFDGKKQTVDAFTLICAVTANEVSASFDDDAIKAQAIAAYSYIKNANDNGDTPDISTDYNYSEKIERNVREIWGLACYHNGKVASTVYSASSAGYTASSENVWGGTYPYLVSVATPFDAASDPNYGVRKTFTEKDIRNRLESYFGITLSNSPANWVVITGYTDGSYVDSLLIDGRKTVSGRKFRENIMDYDIRSSAFDISYYDGTFTVTTYGYGHGVGMSQNGANILAEQGYNYEQILKYYYTGIEVR